MITGKQNLTLVLENTNVKTIPPYENHQSNGSTMFNGAS